MILAIEEALLHMRFLQEDVSKSTQVTQQQLEYNMSNKPKKSAGARAVVKRSPIEKRSSNLM
jgi:hypothetical protein